MVAHDVIGRLLLATNIQAEGHALRTIAGPELVDEIDVRLVLMSPTRSECRSTRGQVLLPRTHSE